MTASNLAIAALSLEEATLPVIDLEGLFTGDEEKVANALGQAAKTSGFFYITGHRIPVELTDALFADSGRELDGTENTHCMEGEPGTPVAAEE